MSDLHTDCFNEVSKLIGEQAEMSASLNDFLEILNRASMFEFHQESVEKLGDIRKGAGSVTGAIGSTFSMMVSMGKWFFTTLGKVIKFAVKGYGGDISSAVHLVEEFKSRIPHALNTKISAGISKNIAERIKVVMEAHAKTSVSKLPGGQIKHNKDEFIKQFNNGKDKDMLIDQTFNMPHPPPIIKGNTLKMLGYSNGDEIIAAGLSLIEAKKATKAELKNVKSREGDVKRIINDIVKKKKVTNAESADILISAFHGAVLAFDIKYIAKMEKAYVDMVEKDISNAVSKVTAPSS